MSITYTGFVNGDGVGSFATPPTASTTAVTGSSVGSYPITLAPGTALNYNVTYQDGTLTIGKASLTARADDQVRLYGQNNAAFTVTYTGLVNGDNSSVVTTPTFGTSASAASSVGTYPITLTGGSAVNYTLILQSGTLTIGKAPLTAKADDQSRAYGTSNMLFYNYLHGFCERRCGGFIDTATYWQHRRDKRECGRNLPNYAVRRSVKQL